MSFGLGLGASAGNGGTQSFLAPSAGLTSALLDILNADVVPGTPPDYQICKTIYSYHPLGAILTDAPIKRAMARAREISVPVMGEERLVERFNDTADTFARVGANVILHNLFSLSRIYGIACLAVGERGKATDSPLDITKVHEADLFFNVLDPLNTAGSLVLDQDPNSPNFMKPDGMPIDVAGQQWHPSRLCIKMNEQPLYIDWTTSAYGFVGRSVYQRCFYPLKSFVQSMITDQLVVQKAGMLVYKAENPSSIIENLMQGFMGQKRQALKSGVTGQVASIGVTEMIETLNMQNLDKAFSAARTNILKNIASAAGMPASIVLQETMTEGFGEGTEDAKKEIDYLDFIRQDIQPGFEFLDPIVMRKAWSPEFYETMRSLYPEEYGRMPYETALTKWMGAFKAVWPNLLIEPESERSKTADVKFKAVVAAIETLAPVLDPENLANLVGWVADNVNEADELFAGKLDIDIDALIDHLKSKAEAAVMEPEEGEEPKPRPMSAAS